MTVLCCTQVLRRRRETRLGIVPRSEPLVLETLLSPWEFGAEAVSWEAQDGVRKESDLGCLGCRDLMHQEGLAVASAHPKLTHTVMLTHLYTLTHISTFAHTLACPSSHTTLTQLSHTRIHTLTHIHTHICTSTHTQLCTTDTLPHSHTTITHISSHTHITHIHTLTHGHTDTHSITHLPSLTHAQTHTLQAKLELFSWSHKENGNLSILVLTRTGCMIPSNHKRENEEVGPPCPQTLENKSIRQL